MASGKKIGGVRVKNSGGDSLPAVATPKPTKKIGGVKEVRGFGTSKQMESCPENCPGEWIGPYWIHSRECRWAAVLWNAYGFTLEDWLCPYKCEPTVLSCGWTHDYRCEFWERTGRTPFDHNAPKEAQRVPKENPPIPTGRRTAEQFTRFPKHLEKDTGDDLPF